MTVLVRQIKNKTLRKAGTKPMAISKQLGIKYGTIKGYLYRLNLNETLPPKFKKMLLKSDDYLHRIL
ncbi:hypothetical protein HDV02_004771 [Globomyces sp. JEL0801]|nr:hypothetical protein HDV02_004771 [Globomyces sp. JEL0801]